MTPQDRLEKIHDTVIRVKMGYNDMVRFVAENKPENRKKALFIAARLGAMLDQGKAGLEDALARVNALDDNVLKEKDDVITELKWLKVFYEGLDKKMSKFAADARKMPD